MQFLGKKMTFACPFFSLKICVKKDTKNKNPTFIYLRIIFTFELYYIFDEKFSAEIKLRLIQFSSCIMKSLGLKVLSCFGGKLFANKGINF